ncbi:glycosyltransferase family 39 protein [Nocardia sp. NPDC005998]|uniref:glycosyltransferase family 39 protein n=1 Tax=Nocardia sp. NPDC005998 TaxID=3156894 RepID=UPI0033AE5B3E
MPKIAARPLFAVAVLFAALLAAFAERYGYHRDELYFLAAGRHLDWGYPDQPPLTPLIARTMAAIDADSLLLLRLPSIAAATLVVVAAGLMARELGGGRAAQVLASAAVASAAMVLGVGHLLTTTSFDMAAFALVCLLVLRLLRDPEVLAGGRLGPGKLVGARSGAERDGVAGRGACAGVEREGAERVGVECEVASVAGECEGVERAGGECEGARMSVECGGAEHAGVECGGARMSVECGGARVGVARAGAECGGAHVGVARADVDRAGAECGSARVGGERAGAGADASGCRVATDPRWWLGVGLVVGIGLQNKALLIFAVGALVSALVLVGPRKIFATKYFPMAVGLAVVLWLPYLWWQAHHGWPQWQLSRAIAGGSSGTSDSPVAFVVLQFGLMGPLLVPLWIFGLRRLWRDARCRAFAVAYALMFVVFAIAGGKAYYLGGMYPLLLAAGAVPVAEWLANRRIRWAAIGSVLAVNAVVSAVLFLPVLPSAKLKDSPVLAINYDAGETIGWPQFVRRIAEVRATVGSDIAILTANYGEAGAIERFGGAYGLPTPHSGHNSYWWWGPPSDTATAVIAVGLDRDQLMRYFAEVEPVGRIDNGLGIDNDEQGQPLFVCRVPRAPWSELWPQAKLLG